MVTLVCLLTLPDSLTVTVVMVKQDNAVEYRNDEKPHKLRIAFR